MIRENVDRKIQPKDRKGDREVYADNAHRLSPGELYDLRYRLRGVQASTTDPDAQIRAVRLLDLVDRAEELEARHAKIGAATDAAVELADEIETLADTVGDAIRFDLSETVNDLIDDGTVDPRALAAAILEALEERVTRARERVAREVSELKQKADEHAQHMEKMTDEEG